MQKETLFEKLSIKKEFQLSEKAFLREEYRDRLKQISPERRYYAKETLLSILKPKLEPFQKILSFASLKDEIDLSKLNQYLVEEKKLHLPHQTHIDFDCILVPGLAFDLRGYRLGRGGGFYDKLLAKYPHARTMGLMFLEQIHLSNLPIEPHDIPVQELCPF